MQHEVVTLYDLAVAEQTARVDRRAKKTAAIIPAGGGRRPLSRAVALQVSLELEDDRIYT